VWDTFLKIESRRSYFRTIRVMEKKEKKVRVCGGCGGARPKAGFKGQG